ncbi:hypothetical protein CDV36_009547 [Fusarium kuroshium]|uniref:NB-ARC domain-containing protein n=2 Tax=Fusarium solani species complex TaxID=232080 RepID=A0A3M2RZS1_9HYPO|nr:hypothetical protein CDV36_009547 [Fusarium kuroshium]RSL92967.1 hypothetical protein CEP52_013534 [Fusarium oligoseptatum]
MEPVEIVGVAAAAIQFAQAGMAITKLLYSTISNLKSSTEVQRERLKRISQLEALFVAIIPHPTFQTEAVKLELENCLRGVTRLSELVNRLSVSPTASKWKTWSKRVHALLKDDEIERHLAILERDKGSLALALQAADSQLLSNLGVEVKSIHGHVLDMSVAMNTIAQGVENTNKALPQVLSKLESLETATESQPAKKVPARFINVPYHRVRDFVGRAEDLATLKHHLLDKPQGTEARCVALTGLPGQGKTSLAIEYCRRHIDQPYQSILWIDASSHNTIDYDMAVCAEILSHHDGRVPLTVDGKAQAVFSHLANTKTPWLVVFDNVEKPEMMLTIKRCFPVAQNASVLITTRRQNAQDFLRLDGSVTIGNMKEEDSMELLLQASKSDNTKEMGHRSKSAARKILSQLWMNPLAIVQAGRYIYRSRLDFDTFLKRCKDQSDILSDRLIATDYITNLEGPEMAQVLSVYTTWDLSIRQVKNDKGDGPRAHKDDLLNIIAFQSSSSFSESRFVQFCSTMQPWDTKDRMADQPGAFLAACLQGWDSRAFGDILAELYDAGLVQQYDIGKDGFYHGVMHGMVQDIARLRLTQAARNEYENLHLDLVFHSGPSNGVTEPSDINTLYETTGDWLSDLVPLAESWAMPPWEQQVAQLILDVASSELGGGFPEFHDNRDFAIAIEELSSEVGMFAQGPRVPGADERLVDKISQVAQFAAEVDEAIEEAIDDFHDAMHDLRAYASRKSLLPVALGWLLPVLKQSGIVSQVSISHVEILGQILALQDSWSNRAHGKQLLKAVLALRILEPVQSEVPLDIAWCLFLLGQAFLMTGYHEEADIILKACLNLLKVENADSLFILLAMRLYGENLMRLDDRERDALSTLKAAADA